MIGLILVIAIIGLLLLAVFAIAFLSPLPLNAKMALIALIIVALLIFVVSVDWAVLLSKDWLGG